MNNFMTWTDLRLNDVSPRSCFAMLVTDWWLIPTWAAICRVLKLVPGLPSCQQISSSTAVMFVIDRAVFGRPLTGLRHSAEPVSSTRLQMRWICATLHFFSGYSNLIALAPNPCSRKVWIRILSQSEITILKALLAAEWATRVDDGCSLFFAVAAAAVGFL